MAVFHFLDFSASAYCGRERKESYGCVDSRKLPCMRRELSAHVKCTENHCWSAAVSDVYSVFSGRCCAFPAVHARKRAAGYSGKPVSSAAEGTAGVRADAFREL